jgi:hypothetical protein
MSTPAIDLTSLSPDLQARFKALLGISEAFNNDDYRVQVTVDASDLVIEVFGGAKAAAEEARRAAEAAAAAADAEAAAKARAAVPTKGTGTGLLAGDENESLNDELDLLGLVNSPPPGTHGVTSAELEELEKVIGTGQPPKAYPISESEKSITLSKDDKALIPKELSAEKRKVAEQLYLTYKRIIIRVQSIKPSERPTSNAIQIDDVNAMIELYSQLIDANTVIKKDNKGNTIFPYLPQYDMFLRQLIKTIILYLFTHNEKDAAINNFKSVPGSKGRMFSFTFNKNIVFELPIQTNITQNGRSILTSIKQNIIRMRGGRRQTRKLRKSNK